MEGIPNGRCCNCQRSEYMDPEPHKHYSLDGEYLCRTCYDHLQGRDFRRTEREIEIEKENAMLKQIILDRVEKDAQ